MKKLAALATSTIAVIAGCLAAPLARAVEVDMSEVRRVSQEPVRQILQGTPFIDISDADYLQKVDTGTRPVIVVFYADKDEKSRLLATLRRYLATEFSNKINFYAYRASNSAQVGKKTLQRLQKSYGVKQIPATLFYDNDKGKMELERTNYAVPTLTEYRTPSTFFFKIYYNTISDYINKNMLD